MADQPRHAARKSSGRKARRAAVAIAAVLAVGAPVSSTFQTADAATTRTWNRLAGCESGGNWHINTGNGYYGGLQFSYSTWRAYGGGKYARTADKASKTEQIRIAEKVLKSQGWGAWPHCSQQLGLTSADARATDREVNAQLRSGHNYDGNNRRTRVRALERITIR